MTYTVDHWLDMSTCQWKQVHVHPHLMFVSSIYCFSRQCKCRNWEWKKKSIPGIKSDLAIQTCCVNAPRHYLGGHFWWTGELISPIQHGKWSQTQLWCFTTGMTFWGWEAVLLFIYLFKFCKVFAWTIELTYELLRYSSGVRAAAFQAFFHFFQKYFSISSLFVSFRFTITLKKENKEQRVYILHEKKFWLMNFFFFPLKNKK